MSDDSPVAVIYDGSGNAATIFPAGFIRTTDEPRQIFYDPFDSALDTTNRWVSPTSSGGGVAASTTAGVMTLGSGTTASGYSHLQSQPSFVPTIPAWLGFSFAIKLEFAVTTNAARGWGAGTSPGTPTTSVPLTDGVAFEIDTAGKLNAVVYASGVRTVVQDLSSSTGNSTQPADNLYHRYIIYVRTDKTYWYIDNLATPVAVSNFQSPNVQTLPMKLYAVAGATPPGSSAVISCTGLATWDTGKNATQLSDGTYSWRKTTIDSKGNLQTKLSSTTPGNTSVAASASSVNLLALNSNRLGAAIYNDSSVTLYVKLGTTASTSSYTVQIAPLGYYEVPYGYTGNIDGIWASATGNARITELT
jgi:hypothetical protein